MMDSPGHTATVRRSAGKPVGALGAGFSLDKPEDAQYRFSAWSTWGSRHHS
jgi:hypothetical protein